MSLTLRLAVGAILVEDIEAESVGAVAHHGGRLRAEGVRTTRHALGLEAPTTSVPDAAPLERKAEHPTDGALHLSDGLVPPRRLHFCR